MDAETYVPAIENTSLKRSKRTGNWEICWTIPSSITGGRARTRTRSCHTSDHSLAVKIRREYLSVAATAARAAQTLTIDTLCALYEADYLDRQGKAPTQEFSLRPVRALLGALEPGNLSAGDLVFYKDKRAAGEGSKLGRKATAGTIRRELGALRAVLGWALKEGHLPRGFVLPYIALPPEGAPRDVYLEVLEERRLHETARLWARTPAGSTTYRTGLFTVIALNTAARSESIENLTWDRVDLRRKLIDFRPPGVRATKKRRVAVPISDRLFPVLARAWIGQGRPTTGPVLGSFGSTRKGFALLARLALPGVPVTRHDLRRTWATLAAQAGVSMFDIAGVLGDTVDTVTRHYAHHSPGHLRGAINRRS